MGREMGREMRKGKFGVSMCQERGAVRELSLSMSGAVRELNHPHAPVRERGAVRELSLTLVCRALVQRG